MVFFVYFESDLETKKLELRLLLVRDDYECSSLIVYLEKGKTLQDSIKAMLGELKSNERFAKQYKDVDENDYIKSYVNIVSPLLNLVLYICAENKEIEENSEQKKVTKTPKNFKLIKDKYREVQIWDCGVQTGEIIRKYKKSQSINTNDEDHIVSNGGGTSKRPHSRRGHWHHYWVGSVGTSERKLILKWVAPTFVNGGAKETIQINVVEK